MTDYRKILMLRSKGCSQREMERSKVASREKTKEVYEAADKLGLSWPLDDDITNAELEDILFPGKYKSGCRYVEPDYPYIHRELAKPGVTMALLWEEYCRKCHEAGDAYTGPAAPSARNFSPTLPEGSPTPRKQRKSANKKSIGK